MNLRHQIQRIALRWPAYGYRRVHAELLRQGWWVNHKRILRLMRADNLLCLRRRKFLLTTDSQHDLPQEVRRKPLAFAAARTADGSGDYQIVPAGTYPSFEPGGNRLAYTVGGTVIFVVNADGLGNTQIVSSGCGLGTESDFAPAWSPLGDKIAFCSHRSGSWQIWTVNPNGSQLQPIPTTLSVQDASYETEGCYLRWSPDGKKIAFTGLTANIPYASRYNVYTMNVDGSNLVQLTNCQISGGGGPSVCSTPSWSPDGTKIAFSDQDTFYGDNYGGSGLYIMNANGSGITHVYQNLKSNELFPQWSSDGKQLVFMGQYSFGLSTYDSGSFWHRVPGFLIQRNAEFLAEHGFDALEIFFQENKLFLPSGLRMVWK